VLASEIARPFGREAAGPAPVGRNRRPGTASAWPDWPGPVGCIWKVHAPGYEPWLWNHNSAAAHTMQRLRSIHLYLGCMFAPLLLFFAVSGIWQTLGLQTTHPRLLARLSTIHTAHSLKAGGSLSSSFLKMFVLIMGMSFIVTTILGVVMAVKYGRNRRAAYCCLAFGVALPLAFVLIRVLA
jgi:hypothetical protein